MTSKRKVPASYHPVPRARRLRARALAYIRREEALDDVLNPAPNSDPVASGSGSSSSTPAASVPAQNTRPTQNARPSGSAFLIGNAFPIGNEFQAEDDVPTQNDRTTHNDRPTPNDRPIQNAHPAGNDRPAQSVRPTQNPFTGENAFPTPNARPAQNTVPAQHAPGAQNTRAAQNARAAQNILQIENNARPAGNTHPANNARAPPNPPRAPHHRLPPTPVFPPRARHPFPQNHAFVPATFTETTLPPALSTWTETFPSDAHPVAFRAQWRIFNSPNALTLDSKVFRHHGETPYGLGVWYPFQLWCYEWNDMQVRRQRRRSLLQRIEIIADYAGLEKGREFMITLMPHAEHQQLNTQAFCGAYAALLDWAAQGARDLRIEMRLVVGWWDVEGWEEGEGWDEDSEEEGVPALPTAAAPVPGERRGRTVGRGRGMGRTVGVR